MWRPAAPPATDPPINSEPPTLIFYNGNVLTMDTERPTAEAIAVADDKIVAVGSNDDILALQITSTQLIDLQGHTLMPGFVDTHTHILNEAASNPDIGNLENAQQLMLQNGITTVGKLVYDGRLPGRDARAGRFRTFASAHKCVLGVHDELR